MTGDEFIALLDEKYPAWRYLDIQFVLRPWNREEALPHPLMKVSLDFPVGHMHTTIPREGYRLEGRYMAAIYLCSGEELFTDLEEDKLAARE